MNEQELREKRARIWEQAKTFLNEHRGENGILSAEDSQTYEKMEKDIVDLGHEIERQQRADALEKEMNAPISEPLTSKPEAQPKDKKTGRASAAYSEAFWNMIRNRGDYATIQNALSIGVDTEGGYTVPDEFVRPDRAMLAVA